MEGRGRMGGEDEGRVGQIKGWRKGGRMRGSEGKGIRKRKYLAFHIGLYPSSCPLYIYVT